MRKSLLLFVCALFGSGDALPGLKEVAKEHIPDVDQNASDEDLREALRESVKKATPDTTFRGYYLKAILISCIKEGETQFIKESLEPYHLYGGMATNGIRKLCIEKGKSYPPNHPFVLEMNGYFLDYIKKLMINPPVNNTNLITMIELGRVKEILRSFEGVWLQRALVLCVQHLAFKHIKEWNKHESNNDYWNRVICSSIQENAKKLKEKNLINFLIAYVEANEMGIVQEYIPDLEDKYLTMLLEFCVKAGKMKFVEDVVREYPKKVVIPMLLQACVEAGEIDFVEKHIGKLEGGLREFYVLRLLEIALKVRNMKFVEGHVSEITEEKHIERLLNKCTEEQKNLIIGHLKNIEEEKFEEKKFLPVQDLLLALPEENTVLEDKYTTKAKLSEEGLGH